VVVTGGHAPAQAPVQFDMSPVSFAHTYTALPDPLVKTVPADDFAVVMTVPPDDAPAPVPEEDAPALGDDAPAGEAGAAAELPVLAALLHAATTTAAPSAPPTPAASLARLDTRLNLDLPMMLISRPARSPASASRESLSVEVRTKHRKGSLMTNQVHMICVTIWLRRVRTEREGDPRPGCQAAGVCPACSGEARRGRLEETNNQREATV
jgi:hypothetical protein